MLLLWLVLQVWLLLLLLSGEEFQISLGRKAFDLVLVTIVFPGVSCCTVLAKVAILRAVASFVSAARGAVVVPLGTAIKTAHERLFLSVGAKVFVEVTTCEVRFSAHLAQKSFDAVLNVDFQEER